MHAKQNMHAKTNILEAGDMPKMLEQTGIVNVRQMSQGLELVVVLEDQPVDWFLVQMRLNVLHKAE